MRALPCLALLCFAAGAAAQERGDASATGPGDDTIRADATTLDTVRVTAPPPEMEDLYRFRNPVDARGSTLDRYYREPPTPEEISLHYGGYIQYGIAQGLLKAAEQVTRLPGWKRRIQSATARPPPLDDAQQARAARLLREASTDATEGPRATP